MSFYNIALLPPDDLSEDLIRFSQDNFAEFGKGYCLSNEVLPHVTLCQFKAAEKPVMNLNEIKMSPSLHGYFIRDGDGQHDGYAWVEMGVEFQEWLWHLHNYVKGKLASMEINILNENYTPHLTFCRISQDDIGKVETIKIPDAFYQNTKQWKIALGRADENGQFLGLVK